MKPICMDRHYIEGATRHALANAQEQDLERQGEYGAHFPAVARRRAAS